MIHSHIPTTVVVAFNRPDALVRLLQSIVSSQQISGIHGRTVVSIDNGTPEVIAAAARFEQYGIELCPQPRHLGLVEHVLQCGDLTYRYGPVLILEDDLILSPAALPFVLKALPEVKNQKTVAALSLYSFDFNEFAGLPLHKADVVGDIFYARTASSWGQVWWPEKWQEFRDWLRDEYQPSRSYRVPRMVSAWSESSWKRLYNFFLSDKGYYSAIPRTSLSLNDGSLGTHHPGGAAISYSFVRSLRFLPTVLDVSEALKFDEFLEYVTDDADVVLPSCGIRLSDIEFDTAGLKSRQDISKEYVYTVRKQASGHSLGEFAGDLGNPLLVLTSGVRGSGLTLVRSENFDDNGAILRSQKEIRNYFGWLDNRQLLHITWQMVRARLKRGS